jgi:hypothetical protein
LGPEFLPPVFLKIVGRNLDEDEGNHSETNCETYHKKQNTEQNALPRDYMNRTEHPA